ncbi:MAG: hypothetical protein GXP33_08230 [Spirochaetes bacterium]|nr:hypothetical protein [Spirochaetota bacterium]
MDFTEKELKILLQSLTRYRGEVAGATQAERNRLESVEKVIGKIEGEIGPLKAERTPFDREMEESLSVLKKGREPSKKKR